MTGRFPNLVWMDNGLSCFPFAVVRRSITAFDLYKTTSTHADIDVGCRTCVATALSLPVYFEHVTGGGGAHSPSWARSKQREEGGERP